MFFLVRTINNSRSSWRSSRMIRYGRSKEKSKTIVDHRLNTNSRDSFQWDVVSLETPCPRGPVVSPKKLLGRNAASMVVRMQISTTAEKVARFQRHFPNPSWLTSGITSGHQNLVSIFQRIDNCLKVKCSWEAAVHSLDWSWKKMDVKMMMMMMIDKYLKELIEINLVNVSKLSSVYLMLLESSHPTHDQSWIKDVKMLNIFQESGGWTVHHDGSQDHRSGHRQHVHSGLRLVHWAGQGVQLHGPRTQPRHRQGHRISQTKRFSTGLSDHDLWPDLVIIASMNTW